MNRAALAVSLVLSVAPASVAAAPVHFVSGATTYTASSAHAPTVTGETPQPGSRVRTFYPQFSATIDTHGRAPLDRTSVQLFVDGSDVTPAAALTQNTVSYMPHARVSSGWHDVFLEGKDTAGQKFSDAWVFQLQSPDVGIGPVNSGFGFFPVGSPQFGFVHFVLIAPTDGFAALQLCGIPQFAFAHVQLSPVFFLTVPVTIDNGFSPFFGCSAGAFFSPFNGFNQLGQVFIPLPFVGIAGPNQPPNIPFPQAAQSAPGPQTMPIYRRAELPITTIAPIPQTVIGAPARNIVPIYRAVPGAMAAPQPGVPAQPMPVAGGRVILPVTRASGVQTAPVQLPSLPVPQPLPIPH